MQHKGGIKLLYFVNRLNQHTMGVPTPARGKNSVTRETTRRVAENSQKWFPETVALYVITDAFSNENPWP